LPVWFQIQSPALTSLASNFSFSLFFFFLGQMGVFGSLSNIYTG
jgi:hypothetical protein